MQKHFSFARTPELLFEQGGIRELPGLVRRFGERVLLIAASHCHERFNNGGDIRRLLNEAHIEIELLRHSGEPSPETVDTITAAWRGHGIECVVAVGGGSVVDTGKAVSAMLPLEGSVFDYLEGVGSGAVHPGAKIPFIAVPTTAGTGSEATKNAVLSRIGKDGFKKSLRHENFVPELALIDPELTLGGPPAVTAASGMDMLSQLIESYISTKANPMTDTLAENGMVHAGRSLLAVCSDRADDIERRADMAYAAWLSGICLANAGLGVVHGFASSIGGFFDIPHGVICGTLLHASLRETAISCIERGGKNDRTALKKLGRTGSLLAGKENTDHRSGLEMLDHLIEELTETLALPRLGVFGVSEKDVERILDVTSPKNNPGEISRNRMRRILVSRL